MRLEAISRGAYLGQRIPRRVLPGLITLGFWDANHPQHWGFEPHSHGTAFEIHYFECGRTVFSARDWRIDIGAGDAVVTAPWVEHKLGDPCMEAVRAYFLMIDIGADRPDRSWRWPSWVALTREDRVELANLLSTVELFSWNDNVTMGRCFKRIGDLMAAKGGYRKHISLLTVLINEALVLLLESLRNKSHLKLKPPVTAQQQVEQFWKRLTADTDELCREWTLQTLAEYCGMGKTQFVRYTKHLYNLPPLHYLSLRRLELAARRLREQPNRSITAIGMECGFSSSHYFASQFKRQYGCTPNVYRLV